MMSRRRVEDWPNRSHVRIHTRKACVTRDFARERVHDGDDDDDDDDDEGDGTSVTYVCTYERTYAPLLAYHRLRILVDVGFVT